MSHFVVLVIGDDIERQLAPYDENIEVEPYREDEDVDVTHIREYIEKRRVEHAAWVQAGRPTIDTDDERQRTLGIQEIENGTTNLPSSDASDIEVVRWYYDDTYDQDEDGNWFRMSTYSPESKWDWWAIGGRWAGFFLLKDSAPGPRLPNIHLNPFSEELAKKELEEFADVLDGRHTDQARKDEIDFEQMKTLAREKAGQEWDAYWALVEGTPPPKPWVQVRAECGWVDEPTPEQQDDEAFGESQGNAVVVARKQYGDQPRVQVVRASRQFFLNEEPDEWFGQDREAFMDRAAARSAVTYAVVKDGQWYARGKMGWWGFSRDEINPDEWNDRFWELLDSLPGETLLTVVDCHV